MKLYTIWLSCFIYLYYSIAHAQLAESPWPMFRHDPQHSGRSPFKGPDNPVIKYRLSLGSSITSSPSIGIDGTIFIGTEFVGQSLFAINEGGIKWWFRVNSSISSSPAVGADGTIYFGTDGLDGNLYALDSEGKKKWSFQTGGRIESSPLIGQDSTIYFGSYDSNFYAIDNEGVLQWVFQTQGAIESSPAQDKEGNIYFVSTDGQLYSITQTGSLRWSFLVDPYSSSPSIDENGVIYIGSNNTIYAINSTGKLKWFFEIGEPMYSRSSPAISNDHTIYVGNRYHNFFAIDSTGALKWKFEILGGTDSSPIIDREGTVYLYTKNNTLYSFHPSGEPNWSIKLNELGANISSPAIDSNGILYIGDHNFLYAIGNSITSVNEWSSVGASSKFQLMQNYPNPFNPSTKISYSIPNSNFVTLKIYDMVGREIQTLVSEFQKPNNYVVNFDANKFSSGIYFYRLQVGNDFVETKKMLLMR